MEDDGRVELSIVGIGSTGARDKRLEFRHDLRRSPGVDAMLLTRLRILLGLTRLTRLLRTDDLLDPKPSEVCRARLLGEFW